MMRFRSLCAVSCMLVVALFFTAMLISCTKKAFEIKNPEVLGKWEGGGQTVELFRDGKVTLGTDWKSKQSTGSYEFIDDDTIRVRFKSSRPQDYNFSLSGDSLMVTRADGKLVGEYKRVNQSKAQGEG